MIPRLDDGGLVEKLYIDGMYIYHRTTKQKVPLQIHHPTVSKDEVMCLWIRLGFRNVSQSVEYLEDKWYL